MDRRRAYNVDGECDLFPELKIIAFKCRICKKKCEIGEEIVKAIDKFELNEFHRKINQEFPDG